MAKKKLLYVGTMLGIRNRAMTKTAKNLDPQWGYKVSITRKLQNSIGEYWLDFGLRDVIRNTVKEKEIEVVDKRYTMEAGTISKDTKLWHITKISFKRRKNPLSIFSRDSETGRQKMQKQYRACFWLCSGK